MSDDTLSYEQYKALNEMPDREPQFYALLLAVLDAGWQVEMAVSKGFVTNHPEATVTIENRRTHERIRATRRGVTYGHALYGALGTVYHMVLQREREVRNARKPSFTLNRDDQ